MQNCRVMFRKAKKLKFIISKKKLNIEVKYVKF